MFGLSRSLVTAASVFPSHVLVLGDAVTTAVHPHREGTHTAAQSRRIWRHAFQEGGGDKAKVSEKPKVAMLSFEILFWWDRLKTHDTSSWSFLSLSYSSQSDKLCEIKNCAIALSDWHSDPGETRVCWHCESVNNTHYPTEFNAGLALLYEATIISIITLLLVLSESSYRITVTLQRVLAVTIKEF